MRCLSRERIPLALAVVFIAACFVVTVWNFSVAALFPRLSIRNWSPIYGLTEETSPAFTLANFLSGDLQAAFSRRIGTSLPIYAPAIRLRNQIEYSIFGLPNAPSIAFGRDKRLYEWAYIKEYCARSGEENPVDVGRWADKIKDIQDYATTHGKTFVYLITPSKAAVYPEYLPDSHPCPAASRGTVTKLPPYTRALDERGVHYLDGSGLMAAERERHGIELFPRGGTHWNALGAGLATTRLVALLKAQSARLDLGPIDTTWTISRDPQGTDRDLVSMLNLYWFDTDYAVPKITHDSSQKDKSCRAAKIMEVGGSFLEQVNAALMDSRCRPHISYWFYWNFYHIVYAEGRRQSTPPRDEDRPADLVASDVILLEENEYNIGVTEHLNALHSFVASIAQKNSAGGADTR